MRRTRKGPVTVILDPVISELVRRLADDCSITEQSVIDGCIEVVFKAGSQADGLELTPYNLCREWLETRDMLNTAIANRIGKVRAARARREGRPSAVVTAVRRAPPTELMAMAAEEAPTALRQRLAAAARPFARSLHATSQRRP